MPLCRTLKYKLLDSFEKLEDLHKRSGTVYLRRYTHIYMRMKWEFLSSIQIPHTEKPEIRRDGRVPHMHETTFSSLPSLFLLMRHRKCEMVGENSERNYLTFFARRALDMKNVKRWRNRERKPFFKGYRGEMERLAAGNTGHHLFLLSLRPSHLILGFSLVGGDSFNISSE